MKLKPGLVKYRVEFGTSDGGAEKVLHTVGNLVCGDAYLIDGQSNALATDTREDSPRETHEWVRSYGGPTGRGDGDEPITTSTAILMCVRNEDPERTVRNLQPLLLAARGPRRGRNTCVAVITIGGSGGNGGKQGTSSKGASARTSTSRSSTRAAGRCSCRAGAGGAPPRFETR